jgi:plasmid segregation protein ParM
MPTQLSSNESDGAIHIMLNGAPWVAGVPVDRLENWERELHPDYPSTDSYKALFYAALLKTGQKRIDRLVTGLPVSQYLDFERREALIEQLTGTHQISAKRTVEVVEVDVLPQPVGAYMQLLSVSNEDEMETMEEGQVIVLDPGYFSVDWVAMQGRSLRKDSSGTSEKAMSRVLEETARLIEEECGSGAATKEKLENAIRNGRKSILVFGERVEAKPFLDKAIQAVAPQAMSSLRAKLREEKAGADIILLAGGGGAAYADAARQVFKRGQVIVPEIPVLANAQGFWFYGS